MKPQTVPLTVTDRPVVDVTFMQFLASVSGKVSCLGKMPLGSWDCLFLGGVRDLEDFFALKTWGQRIGNQQWSVS